MNRGIEGLHHANNNLNDDTYCCIMLNDTVATIGLPPEHIDVIYKNIFIKIRLVGGRV